MLWRLLFLLAGAVSQRSANATKSSGSGRGSGRAAVALVGGFSDVTFASRARTPANIRARPDRATCGLRAQ